MVSDTPRIFVTGCPRSGTTFVNKIISAHPEIKDCGIESNLFLDHKLIDLTQGGNVEQYIDYFWSNCYYREHSWSEWVGGLHHSCPKSKVDIAIDYLYSVRDRIELTHLRNFIDMLLTGNELTWVEKTPLHCLHLGDIRTVFNDAIIIYMTRDYNNIVSSLQEQEWFQGDVIPYVDNILCKSEELLKHDSSIISISLESFLDDPSGLINTLVNLGIPRDGSEFMYEEFNTWQDKDIANRIKNSNKRVN